MERMAVSEGVREALAMMERARRLAEGDGARRARMRDSSEASWRMSVNLRGARSLMAREMTMEGSWGVVERMTVRAGSRRGMRGWMLEAVRMVSVVAYNRYRKRFVVPIKGEEDVRMHDCRK